MGQCEDWGKIFMLPRFLDVSADAEKRLRDHATAAARWKRYRAEPGTLTLGAAGP